MREKVVEKLNSKERFTLTSEESQYIISNWLSMHSQHHCSVEGNFDPTDGISYDVIINKDSIYKI